jgi:hypothetical protein
MLCEILDVPLTLNVMDMVYRYRAVCQGDEIEMRPEVCAAITVTLPTSGSGGVEPEHDDADGG